MAEGIAEDVRQPLAWRLKLILKRRLNYRTKRSIKRILNRAIGLFAAPNGREVPAPSVAAPAGLKVGDRVRVRTKEEVLKTLNPWREFKGCTFMPEMEPYCDTTQQVLKTVRRFVDERDYQVKRVKNIVILEGLICQGTADYGQCDRSCPFFWREEWLERIDDKTEAL